VANPDGLLKDGSFGQARLVAAQPAMDKDADHHEREGKGPDDHAEHPVGEEHGHAEAGSVAVPVAAVQAIDGKAYVFVAHAEDLFELRRVEAGPRRASEMVITAGLRSGEKVVASQGFALKSELLKSRLGASCADH
jgi:cobalt-zinc-cadmium efflux system membrane fusion protein